MISHLYREPELSFRHAHKEQVAVQHNSGAGWQAPFQHFQQNNKPDEARDIHGGEKFILTV